MVEEYTLRELRRHIMICVNQDLTDREIVAANKVMMRSIEKKSGVRVEPAFVRAAIEDARAALLVRSAASTCQNLGTDPFGLGRRIQQRREEAETEMLARTKQRGSADLPIDLVAEEPERPWWDSESRPASRRRGSTPRRRAEQS